ncbi:MAG: pilus assembly PilX N-terminal domain-containing protein [Clostridia bacterium]
MRLKKILKSDKGAALVMALLLVAIFSIVGASIISMSLSQITRANTQKMKFSEKYILSIAANKVLDIIEKNTTPTIPNQLTVNGTTLTIKQDTIDSKLTITITGKKKKLIVTYQAPTPTNLIIDSWKFVDIKN